MRRRLASSLALAAGLVAVLLPCAGPGPASAAAPADSPRAAVPGARNVIANLFEWNWPSVSNECRTFLGPRGYGYVQVSPPQEHVRGQQ